jgi:serine/threonine protein kinase
VVLRGFASTEIVIGADSQMLTTGRLLGGGSFADVFTGSWLGTPVAVKMIKGASQHTVYDQTLLALKREVHVLERVRHPCCIMMLGWSQAPLSVITELSTGSSVSGQLAELHRRSLGLAEDGATPLPASERYSLLGAAHAQWALSAARDVARGMVYLHHVSIIHRDLKSANLLAESPLGAGPSPPPPSRVRIADFGLARAIEGTVGLEAAVGSIAWMAPGALPAALLAVLGARGFRCCSLGFRVVCTQVHACTALC